MGTYKGRTLRAMNAVQIWAALAASLPSRFTTAISIVAPPRPSPTTSSAASRLQIATLIVAAMAVLTSAAGIYFVRKTGRETTSASRKLADAAEMNAKAADRAATASEASAAAAAKSAQAAEDSVSLSAQTAETADSRAAADALAKRYQNAAEQLGHERATVRIAGVHAMARLADDWVEQRQACIDVLCSHFRMPWLSTGNAPDDTGDLEVRRSIGFVLRRHLVPDSGTVSWSDFRFDLSGARLIDLPLSGARLTHKVDFQRATFEGTCDLYDIDVPEGADFSHCRIVGRLNISLHVRADLNFEHARIDENGWLDIDTYSINAGVKLLLNHSHIGGRLELKYAVSEEAQGLIAMYRLQIDSQDAVIYVATLSQPTRKHIPDPHVPQISASLWKVLAAATVFLPVTQAARRTLVAPDSTATLKFH
jgi:hypothetical protein